MSRKRNQPVRPKVKTKVLMGHIGGGEHVWEGPGNPLWNGLGFTNFGISQNLHSSTWIQRLPDGGMLVVTYDPDMFAPGDDYAAHQESIVIRLEDGGRLKLKTYGPEKAAELEHNEDADDLRY